MSRPRADLAVVDAGLKAMSFESGMPWVWDGVAVCSGVEYISASDEHGKLQIGAEQSGFALGDLVRLIPGHCDPCVNQHEWYVCLRGDRVEALWPVAARGPGF
jgi:D-serine deaminase-like pyridoxal phosphate-dependent protein